MIESYTFDSGINGPHLLVLGVIHGNEPCGKIACDNIIDQIKRNNLHLKRGRITLVPLCNSKAYARNKRYYERDLNRILKRYATPNAYEEHLANAIANLIDTCDYVLDIHSFGAEGEAFAFQDYDDAETAAFARSLGIPKVLSGWVEVYADHTELNEGDSISYANSKGKTGAVIECGRHNCPQASGIAEKAILNAMAYLGLRDGQPCQSKRTDIRFKDIICKDKNGTLTKEWQHMERIHKGDVIATYEDGTSITAHEDGYILMPKNTADIGEEWFYWGNR